jgi:hypothetical protein
MTNYEGIIVWIGGSGIVEHFTDALAEEGNVRSTARVAQLSRIDIGTVHCGTGFQAMGELYEICVQKQPKFNLHIYHIRCSLSRYDPPGAGAALIPSFGMSGTSGMSRILGTSLSAGFRSWKNQGPSLCTVMSMTGAQFVERSHCERLDRRADRLHFRILLQHFVAHLAAPT